MITKMFFPFKISMAKVNVYKEPTYEKNFYYLIKILQQKESVGKAFVETRPNKTRSRKVNNFSPSLGFHTISKPFAEQSFRYQDSMKIIYHERVGE